MLGEAEPTMEAMEDEKTTSAVVIKITNWNRRTLLIDRIFVNKGPPLLLSVGKIDDGKEENRYVDWYGDDPTFYPPIRISGWTNRSEEPKSIKITIQAIMSNDDRKDDGLITADLECSFRILGRTQEKHTLQATSEFKPM
jgi:hypothetical protein